MKPLFLALAISATAVLAQEAPALRLKAIKNAPFTAYAQTEITQTLPDRSRITRTTTATIARDSEGRTRREQTAAGIAFIYDPIQGLASILDTQAKTVRQYAIPSDDSRSESPTGTALGADTMEGLSVEGTGLTHKIVAGEAGNEKSIEVTTETWYSSDLQTVLSSHMIDPRTGDTTFKLTGIARAEPNPALFRVPPDYTIQAIHNDFQRILSGPPQAPQ